VQGGVVEWVVPVKTSVANQHVACLALQSCGGHAWEYALLVESG